jgi:hypothetical protein
VLSKFTTFISSNMADKNGIVCEYKIRLEHVLYQSYDKDTSTYEIKIFPFMTIERDRRLCYEGAVGRFNLKVSDVKVTINHVTSTANISGSEEILVKSRNFRGIGLTRYAFNECINYMNSFGVDYLVSVGAGGQGRLVEIDKVNSGVVLKNRLHNGDEVENWIMRDNLYKTTGFKIKTDDTGSGVILPTLLSNLAVRPQMHIHLVEESNDFESIAKLVQMNEKFKYMKRSYRATKHELKYWQKYGSRMFMLMVCFFILNLLQLWLFWGLTIFE